MSNITITSTTSSKEELEHAAGPNWREPFVPAEKPADSEAEPPEGEEPETPAESEPAENTESEVPKIERKSGWQKRVDKLTKRVHESETRAEAAIRRAEEAEAKLSGNNSAKTPLTEPMLKDFSSETEFKANYAAWRDFQQQVKAIEEDQQSVRQDFETRFSNLKKSNPELEELLATNGELAIPSKAGEAIVEQMENGELVNLYLLKNPKIAESLSEMSPREAVREVWKISHSLEAKSSPETKTKAEASRTTQSGRASSTRSSIPLNQLPPREYNRIRDKQERERGR